MNYANGQLTVAGLLLSGVVEAQAL
jgi:hypothetical protein